MKRSEMVAILYDQINQGLPEKYWLDFVEVSDILQELENNGMLPPASPEYGEFGSATHYKNKWEDED